MESWKINIFKKQTSSCPLSYRRSLSEPAYANSEIGTSLKMYPWCGSVKSQRKKNECAVSNLEKPLETYRWQKQPRFRKKGSKMEKLQDNNGDLDKPQQKVLPETVGNNASFSANEILGTSTEKLNLGNTQSLGLHSQGLFQSQNPLVVSGLWNHGRIHWGQWSLNSRDISSVGFSLLFPVASPGCWGPKGESTNEPVGTDILWWLRVLGRITHNYYWNLIF